MSYRKFRNIGFIVILAVIILAIIVSSLYKSTQSSSIIGQQIPNTLYDNLISLSQQGYNVTVSPIHLGVLPYNFSSNGKPAVIFVGAEWCPYCAAERWALIIALLRFGNFTNLEYMLSSSTDVYPNTPTFTFVNSTYTSKYIAFVPIEYENREHQPLEKVPLNIYDMWTEYGNGSIPFIIIGYYYEVGTTIDPGLLAGKNWSYVISQLNNPNSQIYKEIYAQANLITEYICKIDGNNPVSVCSHFMDSNQVENENVFMITDSKI
ncbi:hypothetical protein BFU36_07940 [Sulfolobus sp. A20]|uniref:DUF929 family protein n=1 Tax=Sulfolobaceae TaxID=118883 RepID=UPI000845DDC5|nr:MULTISPECIES: DUF929 family protein [unclassified Sulfolobus]TRM75808.1 DUF929 domain-containing protein [Sulfolobus sp. A20-N-F8]TRM78618.1 DUF929 domain-containing protein [Sulfolobus sp. B5]TRM84520.1 DUF929 domain-containing protein [Sulfolobus sp. F3]TRM89702.1 DUF929 domain-containing protein [Sulfolobus sp. C3]TRM99834.1 DUF929 domain-containing protein [Sulfolobus sp. F1]